MIRPGAYVLFLRFDNDTEIMVGALGNVSVKTGEYCYIGSARNGLDQRIRRHLSREKKIHWHIDHLTVVADGIEAFETTELKECEIRRIAEDSGMVPVIKGFGCSDCRCDTHLLRSDERSRKRSMEAARLIPFTDRSQTVLQQ